MTKPKLRSAVFAAVKHRARSVDQIFSEVLDIYGAVPRATVVRALESLKKTQAITTDSKGWVRK